MNRRMVTGALAALVMLAGLTACQPPPPRPQFAVNTTADGNDANPGDGVCASDAAEGACSLRAAIEEANALGRGDITVPAGSYDKEDPIITVTGNVAILGAGLNETLLGGGQFTVAPLASLRLDRVGALNLNFSIQVDGSLHLTRSQLSVVETPVTVGATGGAVVESSSLVGGLSPALVTNGNVVIDGSSLLSSPGSFFASPTMDVRGDGAVATRGSMVANGRVSAVPTCVGTPPTSLGYNHSTDATCGLSAAGDGTGETLALDGFLPLSPAVDSVLVDAIPLGTGACVEGATDALDNPRGVDGNGDGVGGCDIGAIERQPAL